MYQSIDTFDNRTAYNSCDVISYCRIQEAKVAVSVFSLRKGTKDQAERSSVICDISGDISLWSNFDETGRSDASLYFDTTFEKWYRLA